VLRARVRCSERPPRSSIRGCLDCSRATLRPDSSPLLEEIVAAVRPESLRTQLFVMAEADQRDLLPRITVPVLLIWGELDARSPLTVAHQFEQAIPDTRLVVIPGVGHVCNLEQPDQFNNAVRQFCRAHALR
jgi:pimeloyl-ACP methyl ester carboxylesterase